MNTEQSLIQENLLGPRRPTYEDPEIQRLREGIILLQRHQATYGGNLNVPTFPLIGVQSSGKTRLLSIFSRSRIGGPECGGTGTRCPVIYTFCPSQNEFVSFNGRRCEVADVSKRITDHMLHLEDPNGISSGFSETPICVEVHGPTSLHAVIVDIPGLQPSSGGGQRAIANNEIKKMIRAQVGDGSKNNSITPILMLSFHENYDFTYTQHQLEQIFEACENNDCLRNSIVIVSKVDRVGKGLTVAILRDMIDRLVEKFGFKRENICFASLTPEFLLPTENAPRIDEQSTHEEAEQYFRSLEELENVAYSHFFKVLFGDSTEPFRASVGLPDTAKGMFGTRAVVSRIDDRLTLSMRNGVGHSTNILFRKLKSMISQIDLQITEHSKSKLQKQIYRYLVFMIRSSTALMKGEGGDLKELCEDYELSENLKKDVEQITVSLRRSYKEEESDMIKNPLHGFDSRYVDLLGHAQIQDTIRNGSYISERMEHSLQGGAAVVRSIEALGYVIMSVNQHVFTAEEVRNAIGPSDSNRVSGPNFQLILRKLLGNTSLETKTIDAAIYRCCFLYYSQVRDLCKTIKGRVNGINGRLEEFLQAQVLKLYENWLFNLGQKVKNRVCQIVESRYKTLKIDDLSRLISLTKCCGNYLEMFGCDEDKSIDDKRKSDIIETISSSCMNLTRNDLRDKSVELFANYLLKPENAINALMEYYKENMHTAIDRFIQPNARFRENFVKWNVLDADDMKKVNEAVHTFSRIQRGLTFLDFQAEINASFIQAIREPESYLTTRLNEYTKSLVDDTDKMRNLMENFNNVSNLERIADELKATKNLAEMYCKVTGVSGTSANISELLLDANQRIQRAAETIHRLKDHARNPVDLADHDLRSFVEMGDSNNEEITKELERLKLELREKDRALKELQQSYEALMRQVAGTGEKP